MTITGSMLALAPGTRQGPGTGANTGPRPDRSSSYQYAADSAQARAGDGYFTWLDHIWHAAACTRPIRLRGRSSTSTPPPANSCAPSPPTRCPTG